MQGSIQGLKACIKALAQFIKLRGGSGNNGFRQWAADGIDAFSSEMFDAAVDLWGNPKLVDTSKELSRKEVTEEKKEEKKEERKEARKKERKIARMTS